jgi:hypothetical protein
MTSGRSIRGIRAEMADCRAVRLSPLDLVERAQHQFVTAVPALDPGRWITWEVGSDLAPSAIQSGAEIADLRLGIRRPIEGAADGQACSVPCFATQQAASGIRVAYAGRDEHVAPLQPCPEAFECGEDVSTVVGDAAGVIECMALPGGTNKFGWSVGHAGFGPVFHTTQVVQRRDKRLAGWRRVERDPPQQGGEQRAHAPPMRAQFLISPVVGCADQAVDAGDGGFDIGARNLLEQRIPPAHSRKRGVFVCHDKLAKITQHDSCGIEIAQRAQPGFAVCFFGKGEDIGCQRVEELDRIVERYGFEGLEQGREGGRAPWLVQRGQIGRLGGARTARQPRKRGRRHVSGRQHAWAVVANGIDALQMSQQLRRRSSSRRSAQIFQRGERSALRRDQRGELLPLRVGQSAGQAVPQTQGRAIAHTADQTLQRGDAGQQHLVRQQPSGCPVEQQPRAVIPSPAQYIEPAGQPKAGGGVLLQVAESVAFADYRDMTPALPPVAISVQARCRHLAELTGDSCGHQEWRVGWIVEESAEKTRCSKLHREPNPVMRTSHLPDQFVVGGVEMEVPGELLLGGVAGVAAVPRALFVGQKAARHGVRNSGFLRGSGRGPNTRDLCRAKVVCGIASLCDKFRTPSEAQK